MPLSELRLGGCDDARIAGRPCLLGGVYLFS
jgi:hypothetical protein